MKIYTGENVYNAAIKRIEYLFDEFPNVIVGFSGGKDSTVVLNLALEVAKRKNRLPLKVMFIDQEAEYETVINYIRRVMSNPDIEPRWFQMPIKIFNSTSTTENWLHCWKEGDTWLREKEPNSIKKNIYGTERFAELFDKIALAEFGNQSGCILGGVRTEESPARTVALTTGQTYKHITYGNVLNKKFNHYTFYPIYDWGYRDIWKAIHEHNWEYCTIYDKFYQYGVPVRDMRVSNVHHETAITHLFRLQEIEPKTWEKLTDRLSGINTAGQMKLDSFQVKELPYMFKDWAEYRDYLLENLISDKEVKAKFADRFAKMQEKYAGMESIDEMYKVHITAILANDYFMTKISNWECNPEVTAFRKFKRGIFHHKMKDNKYIWGQNGRNKKTNQAKV